jgi:hypothetical protein
MQGTAVIQMASGAYQSVTGLDFAVYNAVGGTATAYMTKGINVFVRNYSANYYTYGIVAEIDHSYNVAMVAEAVGIQSCISMSNGSIPTAKGIYVFFNKTGGTLTYQYGINIGDVNGVGTTTREWAIYTGLGHVRFGDRLTVNGATDTIQAIIYGFTTQAVALPVAQVTRTDVTAGVSVMLGLTALGSGANGDGGSIVMRGKTSTTAAQDMAKIAWLWNDSTQDSQNADLVLSVFDTAEREILRGRGSGSAAMISVLGAAPVVRQAHIIDADGNLADVTAKFNTLLSYLEVYGWLATA